MPAPLVPSAAARPPALPRRVVVAGAGVAGVSAAWALADAGVAVTLVDDGRPGATDLASLVNPFTGPKASPAWRWEASLDALAALLDAAGASLRPGLVRPARDARQARDFAARAAEHPHALAWHPPAGVPPVGDSTTGDRPFRDPFTGGPAGLAVSPLHLGGFRAPHGWLDVRVGGTWLDPRADLRRLVGRLCGEAGLALVAGRATATGETATGAWLDVDADGVRHRLEADAVVLALGDGLGGLADLGAHGLARVGGRRYCVRRDEADAPSADARAAGSGEAGRDAVGADAASADGRGSGQIAAVSVGAYAVPAGGARAHVGGAYDHADPDAAPTVGEGEALAERLRPFVPALGALDGPGEAAVRIHRAGVRRPLVRRLTHADGHRHARVWALTGLGSKGLLAAPLVARGLPAWLAGAPVPDEIA